MRAVVQRVKRASVTVDGKVVGEIGVGLLVLIGAAGGDTEQDVAYTVNKVAGLRIFPDADGKMNLDVTAAGGAVLVVSQFTLMGDCRKGRRPSFQPAERPEKARELYELYCTQTRALGLRVETGVFQADMAVDLLNDGPVTLLIDSRKTF